MTRVSLDELSFATFAGLVNSCFRVQSGPASAVELRLVAATPATPAPVAAAEAPTRESFSLLFCGPAEAFLQQRTYRFTHEQLGAFDLFIVPVGKETDGFRYEAIFNRLVLRAK